MDKKHVPIIEAPTKAKSGEPFEVKLKVGGIDGVEHPNMLSHYITWVELYAGERHTARIEFAPAISDGYKIKLAITLEKSAKLCARAFCNLHGLWEGQAKQITIE
ncbi:MAG: class II SORL domain-containing protein [Candidatus Bathyarchaeota archaeon]|nr:MAG: class II SORL domain-containing protein [Candidatus Bathyarchaeota archaeon]